MVHSMNPGFPNLDVEFKRFQRPPAASLTFSGHYTQHPALMQMFEVATGKHQHM